MIKKIDIIFALLAGFGVAYLTFDLLKSQGIKVGFLTPVLFIFLPILSLIGLWVSWFLGKKFLWIFQAAKFFLVGVLATLFDLIILNVLMLILGVASGLFYSLAKGVSFLAAAIAKYFAVKFWTFEKTEMTSVGTEFGKFFIVSTGGLIINVAVASFIVNTIGPQFGIEKRVWANIGAISAAFVAFLWNFLGSKFIVFKK
jgi:putative flippase GtrA